MKLSRRSLMTYAAVAGAASLVPMRLLAQQPGTLTPGAMRADLTLLLRACSTAHPGLQRYLPADGFARLVADTQAWAARDRSLGEMYLALARLTAAVRCGHTYANPNNQSDAVQTALFGGRDRVPFAFRWIGKRMFVTGGRGGHAPLAPGTEVRAIDGVPVARLLAAMFPLARADGSNDAKRIAQLGLAAPERYPAFDLYRPLVAAARADGAVSLQIRQLDGRERTMELPALTEGDLQAARSAASETLGWRFEIDAEGIGTLSMPDWVTYRSKWDWRGFLDKAVDRLIDERAKALIIDLRGNEGGTECGWHILERLIERDMELPLFENRVRYRTIPEPLVPALDTWDASFRDWGTAATGPDASGFYKLDRGLDNLPLLRPRGRRFTGRTVALVDAACSSATFQFANAVRKSGSATLVGETTGGNRRGINGGAYFFVRLPETGLEVDLPIIGSFAKEPQPDAGVVPDVKITIRPSDLAAGQDRQLAVARRIAKSKA